MTNQKLDVVIHIKEGDIITHTFDGCTADNFLNKNEQNPYAINRSIRLITDNEKEAEVVIKDIEFYISYLNNQFVVTIFV